MSKIDEFTKVAKLRDDIAGIDFSASFKISSLRGFRRDQEVTRDLEGLLTSAMGLPELAITEYCGSSIAWSMCSCLGVKIKEIILARLDKAKRRLAEEAKLEAQKVLDELK